jgi:hypothetical protein
MTFIEPRIIFNHIDKTGRSDHGLSQTQIEDVVNAINKLDLWIWFKDICPKNGFMFTENKTAMSIINRIDTSNHTGFTLGYTMRFMQKISEEILGTNESTCVICLKTDSEKQALMECGHRYHIECIRKWKSTSCPLCRSQTVPFKM